MTAARARLDALPFWPRYLAREQAAGYVGVSPNVFDAEVKGGWWPQPRRRGDKGRLLTWDRLLLDAAADREAGFAPPEERRSAVDDPGISNEEWRSRIRGAAKKPSQDSQKAAR